MLKHLNQNFDSCYKNLLEEMSKRRSRFARLFLLNDQDLLDILCCGNNIEKVSQNIGKVFTHIDRLKFYELTVEGFYGRNNGEYVQLKNPMAFNDVESFLITFEKSIKESIMNLLELAITGQKPPIETTYKSSHVSKNSKSSENKSQGTSKN
jgi:hypothetical protein